MGPVSCKEGKKKQSPQASLLLRKSLSNAVLKDSVHNLPTCLPISNIDRFELENEGECQEVLGENHRGQAGPIKIK